MVQSNSSMQGMQGMNRGSLLEQFKAFKRTFSGDPQAMINNMLNSGRFNNAQIEQAKSLANELRSMFASNK